MSVTIVLDQLPQEAERLLRGAWEKQESVLLEWDGEVVAAVVPMRDYRRIHAAPETSPEERPASADAPQSPRVSIAYELPPQTLAAYRRLVAKKLTEGLTREEEAELQLVGNRLDAADSSTVLEQALDQQARREHQRRMAILDEVISNLRSLREAARRGSP